MTHENSINAVMVTNGEGVISYINTAFTRLLGYSKVEVLGRNHDEVLRGSDAIRDQFSPAHEEGEWAGEVMLQRKDGSSIELQASVHPVHDEHGQLICLISSFVDMSERMEAQKAACQTKDHLEALYEASPDMIFLHGSDGRLIDVNDNTIKTYGYGREEMVSIDPHLLMGEGYGLEMALDRIRKALNGELQCFEWMARNKAGEEFPVEVRLKRIETMFPGNGIEPCVVAVVRDITERKQAESELQESEERYRAIVEDQTELICRFDQHYELSFVNGAVCRYFQKTKDDLIGFNFVRLAHPQDESTVTLLVHSLHNEHTSVTVKHRVVLDSSTEERWLQWTMRAICGVDGSVTDYQAVGYDITDRLNRELALAESERRFRQFAELLPQIVFETDEKGRFTFVNKRALEMTGYSPEKVFGGMTCIETLIPEDRELALKNMMLVMQGNPPGGTEYTMLRDDGSTMSVIIYSSRIEHDGAVKGIRGIVVDITKIREAEEEKDALLRELQEAMAKVKMLSGLLPICTSCKKIKDEDGDWKKLEAYLTEHSEASFSHHACPECSSRLYPGEPRIERILPPLTVREMEVLSWIRQGKSNWEIAAILGISERTIKYHVSGILNKLDVVSRAQAVAVALELGIIAD